MKYFGERLKKLRYDNNVTQDTLAEYLGISYQAISKWENALGFPEISLIPAISNFFGVSSDFLLGIELEKSEENIENVLNKARKFTHTGEIEKSINLIEEALKSFPNEHRLLCDLIEYKVMTWEREDLEWCQDIETKANLILRDCNIDKIRHKTIVNLAFAYSFSGLKDKVLEIAELLPDVAYSKKQLVSLSAPIRERIKYKPDCILSCSECLLTDILTISKHHIFYGDIEIAIEVCNRALKIIDEIGAEGYLLYMQAAVYEDLMLAFGKLKRTDEMYSAIEKVIEIDKQIEKTLCDGGKEYVSPLLKGLAFSKESITFNHPSNSLERLYNYINNSNILKPYFNDDKFISIVSKLEKEIKDLKARQE